MVTSTIREYGGNPNVLRSVRRLSLNVFALSSVMSWYIGCSGCDVWIMNKPLLPRLPHLPLNCSRSCMAFSSARKSCIPSMVSAAITAVSRRLLKSNPLVRIWVPTRMSMLPSANSLMTFVSKFLFCAVSLSSLAMRASGKREAASSSIFWVPDPRVW